MKRTHTIIISDLHIGSSVSQPRKVLKMLKEYSFHKVILLGDIFDNLDFRKISKESSELINFIGKISKARKVRWVEGNHDFGISSIFGSLIGAKVYKKEYSWKHGGKKYLAIHGHQFDRFLIDNETISSLASSLYDFIQKIDYDDKRISHFIKRKSKGWLRMSEKVADSAILYAKEKKADYVFCGHTHKAKFQAEGNISYYNSGCWTDSPCTYLTLDSNNIEIIKY